MLKRITFPFLFGKLLKHEETKKPHLSQFFVCAIFHEGNVRTVKPNVFFVELQETGKQ